METVRQSTSNLESDIPPKQRTVKTNTATEMTATKKDVTNKDIERPPAQLPSNIPVISSLALKSLPPNIKAIPLQMNIRDHLNTTATKHSDNEPLPEKNEEQSASKPALDIPVELLNQIINGEVALHSLSTNSKDAVGKNLVAINTEACRNKPSDSFGVRTRRYFPEGIDRKP